MDTITASQLLNSLPSFVARIRRGARLTVVYRGRPAFQIVPIEDSERTLMPLEQDTLYKAKAVGRSKMRRRN